jgi:predicted phosphoribosyltransferase
MHDRSFFPNEDIIRILEVSEKYIQEQLKLQEQEIERRLVKFRGSSVYNLEGKIVFLVDDGIATGATLFAAIRWLRKQKVKKLVVAVPVGPSDTIARLEKLADEVAVLQAPLIFGSVGEFYSDFSQVTDDEVVRIMAKYRKP